VATSTPGFDRVRPRSPDTATGNSDASRDAQGKRALFSSTVDTVPPSLGSVQVECRRCDERTVLGLTQAVRKAMPSLHLGVRVAHGEHAHGVSVLKRDYVTFMRCPACRRPSWVRFTLQI
jgi:hypothetical protein